MSKYLKKAIFEKTYFWCFFWQLFFDFFCKKEFSKKKSPKLKTFSRIWENFSKNSIFFKTATYTPKTATYTPKTATYRPKTATYLSFTKNKKKKFPKNTNSCYNFQIDFEKCFPMNSGLFGPKGKNFKEFLLFLSFCLFWWQKLKFL